MDNLNACDTTVPLKTTSTQKCEVKEKSENESQCGISCDNESTLTGKTKAVDKAKGFKPPHNMSIDLRSLDYGSKPVDSTLSLEERYALCLSVGEECIQKEELLELLKREPNPICYDGFEPSGRIHIAQGVMKVMNVNKLVQAGCVFVFWVGDWFAMLNNKLNGDLKRIRTVGLYFIEVWKALGLNENNVRFLWASEEINKNPDTYWSRVMDIARCHNITRIKRDKLSNSGSWALCVVLMPLGVAKSWGVQTGMTSQHRVSFTHRKVNMLAREYATQKKIRNKPIILSHCMLPGLVEGQEKMSKSDASSSIFMDDSVQEVNLKIKRAFCPPDIVEGNPCTAYVEHVIFPWFGSFDVDRKESNGGPITYTSVNDFKQAYCKGELHPGDLKTNLSQKLNVILDRVRVHFKSNPEANALLEKVKLYTKMGKTPK